MPTPTPPASMQSRAHALVADYLDDSAAHIHDRLGEVAGVAVSTADQSVPVTLGASTPLAAEVDLIQFDVGIGPCLEALRTGQTFYVPDLANDARWRDYGPKAAARGARSCLSMPVLADSGVVAVFKVYAGTVDGLTEDQRSTAELVAKEISGGYSLAVHLSRQAAELDDMTALLTHRRVIDLALGIMMERAHVPAEQAFSLLRTQSQRSNVKLHDVALTIVSTVPGTDAADLIPHFSPRDVPPGTRDA